MGGSGGGGGTFGQRAPGELSRRVKETLEEASIRGFEASLGGVLDNKLSAANQRDVGLVRERLNEIKSLLASEFDTSIDTLFGGSVAKHTYVDGLSDIDSLLVMKAAITGQRPSAVLDRMAKEIAASDTSLEVSVGRLAVTVTYPDGQEIQCLPAVRVDGALRVPSFRRDGWSSIAPESFERALTKRNKACAGQLVPTIKLAKAIIGQLPEAHRLSGYHMESLAISAFRDYSGEKTTAAMLPVFFERARDLVQRPIVDSSGQSVHVDGYLGHAESAERVAIGHVLGRIAKRMRNASAGQSVEQWEALFGGS